MNIYTWFRKELWDGEKYWGWFSTWRCDGADAVPASWWSLPKAWWANWWI